MRMKLEDIVKLFLSRTRLEEMFKYFTKKSSTPEEKKDPPGIYTVPESESYKKPGINKELTKEILLKYGGPAHVEAYKEITGIDLDE